MDIAAPGVDILSCWKNGEYKTVIGTSMSAPHVAGAAAIFIVHNSNHGFFISTELVRSSLVYSGDYGAFEGDPDMFQEPLLNVSGL